MTASVGAWIEGSGCVSTRTSRRPCQVSAFMADVCPHTRPASPTDMPRSLAVVTGASSGIGLELAKQFAANDFDLVIAAEDTELSQAAEGLRGSGIAVEAVQVDLSRDGAVDELYARIKAGGRPVAAAALNAGIGSGGAFAE